VAAPSKLQRPTGDRIKTDARDARHLARLLYLGQIVEVAIPSVEMEAARDLVRAREDSRGDLITPRGIGCRIASPARDHLLRRQSMDRQA
jgi:transposase